MEEEIESLRLFRDQFYEIYPEASPGERLSQIDKKCNQLLLKVSAQSTSKENNSLCSLSLVTKLRFASPSLVFIAVCKKIEVFAKCAVF